LLLPCLAERGVDKDLQLLGCVLGSEEVADRFRPLPPGRIELVDMKASYTSKRRLGDPLSIQEHPLLAGVVEITIAVLAGIADIGWRTVFCDVELDLRNLKMLKPLAERARRVKPAFVGLLVALLDSGVTGDRRCRHFNE